MEIIFLSRCFSAIGEGAGLFPARRPFNPLRRFDMQLAHRLSALVLIASIGSTAAQETIDNQEFTNWSKYPKGTSITLKTTSTTAGVSSEATITTTLVEVGSDKLVVEYAVVTKSGGMEFKVPPTKRDVTKTITLPKGVEKPKDASGKPPGTYEDGTETLKVSGTEVKTKWYKYKSEASGLKMDGKIWMSDEVPGTLVRMEMKTTGTATSETKTELVEVKKP
jgi:hypothetical protein